MHARVASFEGGDLERIRQFGEQQRSSGGGPEGMRRVMLLHDHDQNRRLFITFFDSPEAMEASEPYFESMGDEIPEDVRGMRTSVAHYEVIFDDTP
jgi:hypothetical protein